MNNKIIINGVPNHFKEEDIRLIFGTFGDIENVHSSSENKNIFITYKSEDMAANAVSKMNNRIIEGVNITVDFAFERDNSVFIQNMPINIDKDEIKAFFSYYGEISSCSILKNNLLRITFKDKNDREKLLGLTGKIKYGGNTLVIRSNQPSVFNSNDSRCVFVYNIPQEVTQTELYKIFGKFGTISSCGINEGLRGFVNFESDLSALKAVKNLNGKKVKGKRIRVIIKSTKSKK